MIELKGEWTPLIGGLTSIYSQILTLVQVILITSAMVGLVGVIYNMMKANREASESLLKWMAGLIIGTILLEVVKKILFP